MRESIYREMYTREGPEKDEREKMKKEDLTQPQQLVHTRQERQDVTVD